MQTGGSKIEEFLAWEVINSCRGGRGCCFGSLLGTIFGDKAVSFMMASILCKNIATYFILIYTCHIWGSNVYNLQQRTLSLSLCLSVMHFSCVFNIVLRRTFVYLPSFFMRRNVCQLSFTPMLTASLFLSY